MGRRTNYSYPVQSHEAFIVPNLQKEIEVFLQNLNLAKGSIVLDIGCGNQPLRKQMEEKGYLYESIDIQQNDTNNVTYIGSISDELPEALRNNKYDFILCTEVMEHVYNWPAAFKNIASLLKVGGSVFASCPFFYPLHEEPHDYWRPTPYAIKQAASENNLNVVGIKKIGDFWDVLGILLFTSFPKAVGRTSRGNKILRRTVVYFLRKIKKILIKKEIQKAVSWDSKFYVSNIFILRNE